VQRAETGTLDDDVHVAALIEEYEAKIAALTRVIERQRRTLSALGQDLNEED
jgi:hypothetical protein